MKIRVVNAVLLVAGAWCVQAAPFATQAPTVDLGYAVYQGRYDGNHGLNVFKG